MRERLFHVPLFRMFFQVSANLARVDVLNRNDEIGREDFCGVDEQKRTVVRMFVLHPEGDNLAIAVQGAVDADAAVGNLELRDVRRLPRLQGDGGRRYENQNCKKDVVKENARDGNGYCNNAKRHIPVTAALDVFVLIRTPM